MKELTLEEFDEYIAELIAQFKEEKKKLKNSQKKEKQEENDNRNIPHNNHIIN